MSHVSILFRSDLFASLIITGGTCHFLKDQATKPAVILPCDARLRKILWTLYWRGNAQLRERIEDKLRSPDQPNMKPKKELPDSDTVLDEVTTFVTLAKDGAYMAGDRSSACCGMRSQRVW